MVSIGTITVPASVCELMLNRQEGFTLTLPSDEERPARGMPAPLRG